jgi:hypothetical protein
MRQLSATNSFAYLSNQINDLEAMFSPDRFATYVSHASGDRQLAVLYYERNVHLSEALYGVIQGLEVALRNSIHSALSQASSPEWYLRLTLLHPQTCMVSEALAKLAKRGKPSTPGRVVAELPFGFWTSLIGHKYEKSMWVRYLHGIFAHAWQEQSDSNGVIKVTKIDRQPIFQRLDDIRTLRNRIAHHEPILDYPLKERYRQILEAIAWLCPTTSAWVDSTSCFSGRF